MNVYIISSYMDDPLVKDYLSRIKEEAPDFNPYNLDGGVLWRHKSKSFIKSANFILFFCGEHSHESKSIAWEIKTSRKFGKRIYTILLSKDNKLHEELFTDRDNYSGIQKEYKNIIETEDVKKIISAYKNEDYGLLNFDIEEFDSHASILLSQYKLFVQTSETLVDRRLKANTFYLSVNSCFVTVYSIFIALTNNPMFMIEIGIIITILGILLCLSWRKAIKTYGDLNSGKFKVINSIERLLPANMFDAEWKALSDQLNNQKYVSFTKSEQDVPRIFIIAYVLLLIVTVFSAKNNIDILTPIKTFFSL